MNRIVPPQHERKSTHMERRQFLKALTAGAAATAMPPTTTGAVNAMKKAMAPASRPPATTTGRSEQAAAHVTPDPRAAKRALVVIELQGGNDGLSTLIPLRDPSYRKLRSHTLVEQADALKMNDDFGLHPKLKRLHGRGAAVVAGVGVPNPDESHFEMTRRWWLGDAEGKNAPSGAFLGRICDLVGDPDSPCVGLAVSSGSSLVIQAQRVTTLALPDLRGLDLFRTNADDRSLSAFQAGYRALTNPAGPARGADLRPVAASGARRAIGVARSLDAVTVKEDDGDSRADYPGSALGENLRAAAQALGADIGIRVVHVTIGGFDTHSNHVESHSNLMDELDQAVDAFLDDIAQRGLGSNVLVATASEFGRRVPDNGSNGLDHGAASVALLAGPVQRGIYGQMPSLKQLDPNDNLKATVHLHEYLGLLANWMGLPAGEVLTGNPKSIGKILE